MGDSPRQCNSDSNSDSQVKNSQNCFSDVSLENTELLVENEESEELVSDITRKGNLTMEPSIEVHGTNLSLASVQGSSFYDSTKSNMECHSSYNFESPLLSSETVLASTPHISLSCQEIQVPKSQKRQHDLVEQETPIKKMKTGSEDTPSFSKIEKPCLSQDTAVLTSNSESFSRSSNGSWKSHHYNSWSSHCQTDQIPHKSLSSSQEMQHDSNNCSFEKKIDDLQRKIKYGCGDDVMKKLSLGKNIENILCLPDKGEKLIHERFNARVTVTFKVDDKKREIMSTTLSQINELEESSSPASSSGSVFSRQELYPLPSKRLSNISVHSTSSSSTVTSSTSGIDGKTDKNHLFTVPPAPFFRVPVKSAELLSFKCPQICTCTCYCSVVYKSHFKKLSNSASPCTTELLSNTSKEASDIIQEEPEIINVNQKSECKKSGHEESNMMFPNEKSQHIQKDSQTIAPNLPFSESRGGFLVFAKWRGSALCYPGIVRGASGIFWQQRFSLKVTFFDGTTKRIASTDMFPAHFIQPGAKVMLQDGNDNTLYTVASVKMKHSLKKWERKMCPTFMITNNGGIKAVNFRNIVIPKQTYKDLKEHIMLALSPKARGYISHQKSNGVFLLDSLHEVKEQLSSFDRSCKLQMERPMKEDTPIGTEKDPLKPTSLESNLSKDLHKTALSKESCKSRILMQGETSLKKEPGKGVPFMDQGGLSDIKSSDTDTSVSPVRFSLKEMVGDGLSNEWILPSAKKCITNKKAKSSSRIPIIVTENKHVTSKLGPIPKSLLFTGYCYIITHSKDNLNFPVEENFSSDGTDFEGYYTTDVPFDRIRLCSQIRAGGGTVFDFLSDVPEEKLSKSLVVTDSPCRTPNYLFAVVQGVPIYRHDLIVHCCQKNLPISQLMKQGLLMPPGRSLETGSWVVERLPNAMKHLVCLIALSATDATIKVWKKLIEYAGAKVILNSKHNSVTGGFCGISFILADNDIPDELVTISRLNDIPIVSTVWAIETIIQGRPRNFKQLPQYQVLLATS